MIELGVYRLFRYPLKAEISIFTRKLIKTYPILIKKIWIHSKLIKNITRKHSKMFKTDQKNNGFLIIIDWFRFLMLSPLLISISKLMVAKEMRNTKVATQEIMYITRRWNLVTKKLISLHHHYNQFRIRALALPLVNSCVHTLIVLISFLCWIKIS